MTYTANQMAREEIFAGEEDPGHEYFVNHLYDDEEEARPTLWEIYGGTPGPEDGILPGTRIAPVPADEDDLPF